MRILTFIARSDEGNSVNWYTYNERFKWNHVLYCVSTLITYIIWTFDVSYFMLHALSLTRTPIFMWDRNSLNSDESWIRPADVCQYNGLIRYTVPNWSSMWIEHNQFGINIHGSRNPIQIMTKLGDANQRNWLNLVVILPHAGANFVSDDSLRPCKFSECWWQYVLGMYTYDNLGFSSGSWANDKTESEWFHPCYNLQPSSFKLQASRTLNLNVRRWFAYASIFRMIWKRWLARMNCLDPRYHKPPISNLWNLGQSGYVVVCACVQFMAFMSLIDVANNTKRGD